MTELSRRRILRAGAGAAVAVPMTVLAARVAAADPTMADGATGAGTPDRPVMFFVHDASAGEVSVLHGTNEVIVRDTGLVSRILAAVAAVPSSSVVAATTTSI